MEKKYKLPAFILAVTFLLITLTSGGEIELPSKGRGSIIEDLYGQAVTQNESLKSIEEGIERFHKNKMVAIEKLNDFTAYNDRYYAEAKSKAATIIDSTTKQKALALISKSDAGYQLKLTNWKNIIEGLDANERELRDLYALLQLMTTELTIKRFQNSGFQDHSKAKEVNEEIQKVIDKIKVITQ